jgi:pantothenate kinase
MYSQDGYHYTRAELDATLDPKLAHARRGAHWTFDAPAFVRMVHTLKETRQVRYRYYTFDVSPR